MGAIPLPFLFSADRPPSPLVAAFSRVADSGRPAGIPRDLLLLPEGLLSRVLSRPPGLYGQRGPQNVSRRDGISLHPAKSASQEKAATNGDGGRSAENKKGRGMAPIRRNGPQRPAEWRKSRTPPAAQQPEQSRPTRYRAAGFDRSCARRPADSQHRPCAPPRACLD